MNNDFKCIYKMSVNNQNLDAILNKLGLNKRYHIQLMLLILFGFLMNSMHYGNFIFSFEEVNYRCITQNTSQAYCSLPENESCAEWIYDNPDSFVAEFNLACQDWKRTTVGTVHSFGYMCGLLLIGPFSDRVGRKTAIIVAGSLGGIFGMLRSFSNSYLFYVIMEFLEAAIGDLSSPLYILTLEYVSTDKRTLYVLLSQLAYGFGRLLCAMIAWVVPNRRLFLRVIYAPAFLFILYSFMLDESPRWLLTRKRKDLAVAILEKAAKTNKTAIDVKDLEKLTGELEEKGTNEKYLQRSLQSRPLRNRFFICLVWWITSTFVSYGLRINYVSLTGNKHLNFILLIFPEIPSTLACVYFLKRFKRKKPLITCFLATAAFCLAQPFMPLDLPWLAKILFIAGHMMSTVFFAIVYLYTSELFPTYSRNSMHALCSSLGRIGSIVAPQTPLLIPYWSGLPSIVFGLVSLFAGLLTFLVPDVGDHSLPDTVCQAEAVGKPKVLDGETNQETFEKLL